MVNNKFAVCITGASGSIYGLRLAEELSKLGKVYLVISNSGYLVIKEELKLKKSDLIQKFNKNVEIVSEKNLLSPLASGSQLSKFKGVIIIPCSMSTLGNIANGINQNLIHRIGEVALKERIKLILAVRETPYSLIHIENMKKVTLSGGIVFPLSPAFYHNPSTIDDLVNFTVGKILDLLDIENNLFKRWKQ
jgi:4-hydroxy-3-polyprenylbenzoate decarboxylase